MSMPIPAMVQAIITPNGPVAFPNACGSENIPAPTMEPTTMPVNVTSDSFASSFPDMVHSPSPAIGCRGCACLPNQDDLILSRVV
ncbi:hypothetical protein D3C81_2210510 [compost metagenome]